VKVQLLVLSMVLLVAMTATLLAVAAAGCLMLWEDGMLNLLQQLLQLVAAVLWMLLRMVVAAAWSFGACRR
jgi:hypothetical protein